MHWSSKGRGGQHHAGLLADIRSAPRSPGRPSSVRVAQGRVVKQEDKPAVWNTRRYKELWSLAMKAGDEQEQSRMNDAEDGACAGGGASEECHPGTPAEEEMDVDDLDEVVPLGHGLHLLQSFPVGASSDGSEIQIGAHYPSSGGGTGRQATVPS